MQPYIIKRNCKVKKKRTHKTKTLSPSTLSKLFHFVSFSSLRMSVCNFYKVVIFTLFKILETLRRVQMTQVVPHHKSVTNLMSHNLGEGEEKADSGQNSESTAGRWFGHILCVCSKGVDCLISWHCSASVGQRSFCPNKTHYGAPPICLKCSLPLWKL